MLFEARSSGPPGDASGDRRDDFRPVVGVLAIQGSFTLHARCFRALGTATRLVRKREDLAGLAALVMPGGESTVMALLMRKYGLFDEVRELGLGGLPLFGTCAGAILLGTGEGIPERLGLAPVELLRNAYGTQVDSFTTPLDLAPFHDPFHGVFIRAPRIIPSESVEVLGEHGGSPVLVAAGSILLATFHPELTDDLRLHRYFLDRFLPEGSAPAPTGTAIRPSPPR
jgi:5'-phosphate synthase pdxT subunit